MLQLLQDEGYSVERAFLPDDVEAWKRSGCPLLTYETQTPISHFPLIAISLAYELELAGLITALELAGIPALREQRGPHDPSILLGGPITFSNPLPAAPFSDAILLGEAEESICPAVHAFFDSSYDGWLTAVQGLPGGYVPARSTQLPAVQKPAISCCRQEATSSAQMRSCETCS